MDGVARDFFMLLKGAILLLLMMVGFEMAVATQYTVGDSIGWGLGNNLQSWSSQLKFYVGDDLYFHYPAGEHSVLLVSEDDYKSCNTENPVASDGGTGDMAMTLISSETYYFICGVPGHCAQGLRLSIEVQEPEAPASTTTPPALVDEAHEPPPPYTTNYNTFHRNSAPTLHNTILPFSITLIIALSCALFML